MKKTNPSRYQGKKTGQNDRESSPRNHGNQAHSHTATSDSSDSEGGPPGEGYKPRLHLHSHQEPTYFIGGGNGATLLDEIFNDLGWRKIKDKLDDSYTMKWCELKQTINYNTFKEGEQLVNHIPNCNLLTNKLGLLNSLQEYCRVCSSMKKKVPKLDFIPETFRVEEAREREALKKAWKDGDVWICKPTGRNQGKGIFLVKNREELDQLCQETDERFQQQQQQTPKIQKPMNRVIQRYLDRPLLLKNKKFDIRAYMLVASTVPYLVLYHKGYIRLSMFEYENKFDNLAMHLTNQFIQKKDPMYKDMKEETIWDMDRLNAYINEHIAADKGLPQDWAHTVLPVQMKNIMSYCFNAVKHRLQCKVGYSDLYGFDFMIDDDMKVWLIEVNVNPTLATNCDSLKTVIPPMVKETIYLAIECFDKSRKSKSLFPIQSLVNFEVIFNGSPKPKGTQRQGSPSRAQATRSSLHQTHQSPSPVRRSRSISPSKEGAENSRKAGMLSSRPRMKPSPTAMLLPIPRQNAASSTQPPHRSSQAPSHTNRAISLQPFQKSPYMAQKASASGTSSKAHNSDNSPETSLQPRYGPRPALPKNTISNKHESSRGASSNTGAENGTSKPPSSKDNLQEQKTSKADSVPKESASSQPITNRENVHSFSKFLQDPVTTGTQSKKTASSPKNPHKNQPPKQQPSPRPSPASSKRDTSTNKNTSKAPGASKPTPVKSTPTKPATTPNSQNSSNNNNVRKTPRISKIQEESSSNGVSSKKTLGQEAVTNKSDSLTEKASRGS